MTEKANDAGIGARCDPVSVDEDMPPKKVWARPLVLLPSVETTTTKTYIQPTFDTHLGSSKHNGPNS
jgi:hypothetical protein